MPLELIELPARILAQKTDRCDEVLTRAALNFLTLLHRRFDDTRRRRLQDRADRQAVFDAGGLPDFLPQTAAIRAADWQVRAIPAEVEDRRVEITGPVDRKMIINALNSGAKVFMADFEDATSPTFDNLISGQANLMDRWRGRLTFDDPANGKSYALAPNPAVLMVRPRGWHLPERHVFVDGEPIAGALFDFGLYVFHNAEQMLKAGSRPYFYLPKLESHLEARLWSEVIHFTEQHLGLDTGTIRVTVLIETLPAAFEMDEILYELRDHILGLNCGRWDYIFSVIKRLGRQARFLTPDRARMTMDDAFLRAYSRLLIKTCHRRGAFAMGGMAAQIPARGDAPANTLIFRKVELDKEREANDGHDGCWVAHPALAPVAQAVFDKVMPTANQIDRQLDIVVTQADLLKMHAADRTEAGLREDIRVGIQYIAAWLDGRGAVPLYGLMEDAATAEISRAQIWQWLNQNASIAGRQPITPALVSELIDEEVSALVLSPEASPSLERARLVFEELCFAKDCPEFLTLAAYPALAERG
jgi:malate synthase